MAKHKIVIVEDDYGVQDAVTIIFDKAGYNTVVLVTPQPLYDHLHDDASIVILDRQLGEWDGLEICRQLKQSEPFASTPILIMSASKNVSEDWVYAHADGFIEKPFHRSDLLQQIQTLLTERKGIYFSLLMLAMAFAASHPLVHAC